MQKNVKTDFYPKYEIVLFDLDGTILDTALGITEGVKYAIEKMGLAPLTYEELTMFIGPPLRGSFKKYCGVSDEGAEELIRIYREYYSEKGLYECKPYEGIENLLEKLKAEGRKLYVATAKPTGFSISALKYYNLLHYFVEVVGASLDKSRDSKDKIIKEIADKEDVTKAIMIGDTCYDVYGARANNIKTIGVLYGFGDNKELIDSKPDFIAETVQDIYKFIK